MISKIDHILEIFFDGSLKATAIIILLMFLCLLLLKHLDQRAEIENLNYRIRVLTLTCTGKLL